MAKKKQRLKPDTVLKNYWSDNERFADLFNAVLFKGRQTIHPDELEAVDTGDASVMEHRDYAERIEAFRDNIKIRKKSTRLGVVFVMLGLENQECIHYAMPMRIMGYDYSSYKKQYDSNAGKYKTAAGMSEAEYLSRMKRTDKFIPVITIVVYYGEQPWDGATSLHGMLNIPEEMKSFVNDYKMRLVEARENKLILHNVNNKDLFNLLEILLDKGETSSKTREKATRYVQEHNVDKTVVMTAAGATNRMLDYNALTRKGGADMCTVFEETWMEGKMEGKIEGKIEGEAKGIVETGFAFGGSANDILERLQSKLNVPLQKAQEYLEIFG